MRVLLADDRVWLRSALRLLLEQEANVEVVGEAAGINALPRYLRSLHPDLLFLDWQLPGLEVNSARQRFLDTVRDINPDLFIVAITNDDNLLNGGLAGADAFVNRAEPPERILAVLKQAASRNAHGNTNRISTQ